MIQRIGILASDDFVARIILKDLSLQISEKIKCVVISQRTNAYQKLIRSINQSGIRLTTFQIINQLWHKVFVCRVGLEKIANQNQWDIIKATKINQPNIENILADYNLDILLSIQFDQIIKKRILDIPRYGVINFHKALLPKYRGMAPLFWALLNGENKVGNTIHFMDEGIDTGALIQQEAIDITPKDSLLSIYAKCAATGANLIHRALNELEKVQFEPVKQPRSANYYKSPHKNDVNDFRKRGGKFYYVRDLLKIKEFYGD